MAAAVDICNVALTRVDRKRITGLTEGSTNANLCRALYDPLRLALLRSHDWNFARRRFKLAREAAPPATGFDHAFRLPADWVRTVVVADGDDGMAGVRYRQEGASILASAPDIYLTYVADITDANLMPADFRDALAWLIASQIAKTATDRGEMEARYERAMRRAKSADAIEDGAEPVPDGSWVTSRAL